MFEITKDTNPKDAIGSRKPRWFSYIPLRALIGPGLAFLEGALKYGKFNWRIAGVRASVYADACVNGHMVPWMEGQDIDPASGAHHIDKAIACLLILRDSMLEGNWVDDRPPAAKGFSELMAEAEKVAVELIERYPAADPWTEARRRRETIVDGVRVWHTTDGIATESVVRPLSVSKHSTQEELTRSVDVLSAEAALATSSASSAQIATTKNTDSTLNIPYRGDEASR